MNIEDPIPLLETILTDWQPTIGSEHQGYRNHVYRMIHFCLTLKNCTLEEREKIIIHWRLETIFIISGKP